MAPVTNTEKNMAHEAVPPAGQPARQPEAHTAPAEQHREGGFFTIYKKGQGYWTRMGTAAGAAVVGGLTAHFLYTYIPIWMSAAPQTEQQLAIGISAAFLVVYGLLVFWLMNKAQNADFLIATDSEMKKVNWTSRKELIGSTKVVVFFMILLAGLLFVIDIVFHTIFYFMNVLKVPPFFINT